MGEDGGAEAGRVEAGHSEDQESSSSKKIGTLPQESADQHQHMHRRRQILHWGYEDGMKETQESMLDSEW